MSAGFSSKIENRLLNLLPPEELQRFLPHLEPVPLDAKQVLYESGGQLADAYFPLSGMVSCMTLVDDGSSVEVAAIGNEGMIGVRVLLGAEAMRCRVVVRIPGQALRMPAKILKAESDRGGPLANLLFRYLNTFLTQVTQSAACNSLHPLEKRCCRWLLMTHDRVKEEPFPLTHATLAEMLGVRRASVTETASKLQKAGLIQYVHGKVTILDRAGLEAASCGCYRIVKEDFEKMLG